MRQERGLSQRSQRVCNPRLPQHSNARSGFVTRVAGSAKAG